MIRATRKVLLRKEVKLITLNLCFILITTRVCVRVCVCVCVCVCVFVYVFIPFTEKASPS